MLGRGLGGFDPQDLLGILQAVTHQPGAGDRGAVGLGGALGIGQVDELVTGEVRVQHDIEITALTRNIGLRYARHLPGRTIGRHPQ